MRAPNLLELSRDQLSRSCDLLIESYRLMLIGQNGKRRRALVLTGLAVAFATFVFSMRAAYADPAAPIVCSPDNSQSFLDISLHQFIVTLTALPAAGITAIGGFFWSVFAVSTLFGFLDAILGSRGDGFGIMIAFARRALTAGLTAGAFTTAATWIPFIINGIFGLAGELTKDSGASFFIQNRESLSLRPIFTNGLCLASTMVHSIGGNFWNPAVVFPLVLSAFVVLIGYVVMGYAMYFAIVESYLAPAVASFMVAGLASDVTMPFFNKFVGGLVEIGLELLTIGFIAGYGNELGGEWIGELGIAGGVGGQTIESMAIGVSALTLGFLIVIMPRVISSKFGAPLAMTVGAFVSAGRSIPTPSMPSGGGSAAAGSSTHEQRVEQLLREVVDGIRNGNVGGNPSSQPPPNTLTGVP